MCSTASADHLTLENGKDLVDADGDRIDLDNNPYACDPTYDELMDFVEKNKIDRWGYKYPDTTCGNFAEGLHNIAELEFIRSGILVILNDDNDYYHCINVFYTVDKGYVYIDCTSAGEDGDDDWGDSIIDLDNPWGYTATCIENPELSYTQELPGNTHFEMFW